MTMKENQTYRSKYYNKINSRYNFTIHEQKFNYVQSQTRNAAFKHFRNAFIL